MTAKIVMLARANDAAAETEFRAQALGSDDPFGEHRRIAFQGPCDISAGVVAFSGTVETARFPHVEMLVVHSGMLEIEGAGKTLHLGVGQGAVIGANSAVHIAARQGAVFAFCAAASNAPSGLVEIDDKAALSTSNPPPAEFLVGPVPSCRNVTPFQDQTVGFRAGVWDSTPYVRRMLPHRLNELMHITEGSVTLTDGASYSATVNSGDTVFVPKDAPCTWESTVKVRKFFAIQAF